MRKIIGLFLMLTIGMACFFQSDLKHFFYKRWHSGLINYDYEIISIEDLKKADEGSLPVSPFDGTDTGYPYWQCFNKNYLKMECDYEEPLNKQGSSLEINVETGSEIHFYSLNHAVSGEVCDQLLAKISNILKNHTYFCINGTHGTLDRAANKREYSWSFHRLKTKAGYAHYYVD